MERAWKMFSLAIFCVSEAEPVHLVLVGLWWMVQGWDLLFNAFFDLAHEAFVRSFSRYPWATGVTIKGGEK